MKKILSLLMGIIMIFTITACGKTPAEQTEPTVQPSTEDETGKEDDVVPQEDTAVEFAFGTPLTAENEYTAEDGTVLLTEKYEFPQLELRTADGEVFEPEEGLESSQADICKSFNEEMSRLAEDFHSTMDTSLREAQTQYDSLSSESREYWANYAQELVISATYQATGIISVVSDGYVSLGGAHPSTYSRTWNYDLTTGEFITFDTLTGYDNPLGKILSQALTLAVFDQIDEQGLAENYYDEYSDYVEDLSSYANFHLQDSGMVINFDVYVLGPYVIGPQSFTIPYNRFVYALDDHTQSLLDLTTDTSVLSDYFTAQTYWSWFNLSMPPLDSEKGELTASDGTTLYPVDLGYVKSLDSLRELLCGRVNEDLVDEWLSGRHFREEDGILCATMGQRGSDINIGEIRYNVELDGESGRVIQTVYWQSYDESTGTLELSDETDDFIYPFDLVNGHAVFSAFPCPF